MSEHASASDQYVTLAELTALSAASGADLDAIGARIVTLSREADDADLRLAAIDALRNITRNIRVPCQVCGSPVGPLTNYVCEATDDCWDIAYCPLCGKALLEYDGWCEHLVGWNGGCMLVVDGVTADWPVLPSDLSLSHDYTEVQLRQAFGDLTFAAQFAYDLDAPNLADAYRQVEVRFGYEDESSLTAELLDLTAREGGLWCYDHGDSDYYGATLYADTPEKGAQAREMIRRMMWKIGEALLAQAGVAPEACV